MLSSGDHELGARTTTWALTQYPSNKKLQELKELAFLKLKEKYQEFNPFKFIIYSQSIHHETPQLQQFLPNKGIEATLNLPRKSRHLDLTKEEVSDAESRAEKDYSLQW